MNNPMHAARFVLVVLVCTLVLACSGERQKAQSNVLLIMTDDLPVSVLEENLGSYPNIRALMQRGVTFENSFVTQPVCCPSRATSLTGMYSHNHHVGQPPEGGGEMDFRTLEGEALPVIMQRAGYDTAYIGKYLNGYDGEHRPPGWNLWGGVEPSRMATFGVDGRNAEGVTHTEVFGKDTASFIREERGEEPFFVYLATIAPHEPPAYPARYDSLFSNEQAPRNAAFNEKDVSDKPRWVRKHPLENAQRIEAEDDIYRDMARSMKDVDDMVSVLVGALGEQGELDNTYVILTSDNGFHFGTHRLPQAKWTAYEEDIRVPLVVAGPGVPEGQAREQMVLNNDLAPTTADWAGTEMPATDGRSFAELLTGDSPRAWRKRFEVEGAYHPGYRRPPYQAVRTERWLYVDYETPAQELYDLQADPHELENVAKKKPGVVERLSGQLEDLRACEGQRCREAEGG